MQWQKNPDFIFNPNRPSHNALIFAGNFDSPMNTDLTFYLDTVDSTIEPRLVIRALFQDGQSNLYLSYPSQPLIETEWTVIPWNVKKPNGFIVGSWYEIQMHLKMNSFGTNGQPNGDGEIKLWVNGLLVTDYTNSVLRGENFSLIKFERFLFAPNYPPAGPPQNQESYLDDLIISNSYVTSDSTHVSATTPNAPHLSIAVNK